MHEGCQLPTQQLWQSFTQSSTRIQLQLHPEQQESRPQARPHHLPLPGTPIWRAVHRGARAGCSVRLRHGLQGDRGGGPSTGCSGARAGSWRYVQCSHIGCLASGLAPGSHGAVGLCGGQACAAEHVCACGCLCVLASLFVYVCACTCAHAHAQAHAWERARTHAHPPTYTNTNTLHTGSQALGLACKHELHNAPASLRAGAGAAAEPGGAQQWPGGA